MAFFLTGATLLLWQLTKEPGSVYNSDVAFQANERPEQTPQQPRHQRSSSYDWPTYGLTPERTRYLAASKDLKPPFNQVWKRKEPALVEFPPVISKNRLYVLCNNGLLTAVDKERGKTIWKRKLGTLAASSPTVSNETVYVTVLQTANGNGLAAALDAHSGKVKWSYKLPSRSESSPLVLKDKVYFGSEGGTIYALAAKSGRKLWTYDAGGAVKGALATDRKGRLFFGAYGGNVYSLAAESGRELWHAGSGSGAFHASNFYSTAAVAYGRVYLGNTDGRVYSFSTANGKLAWAYQTGSYVYSSPAIASPPGLGPTVYVGSYSGSLYALNAKSGRERWRYSSGGKISGAPSIIGDIVYFSDLGQKQTYGLKARSGKRVFKFNHGSFTPAISDGKSLFLVGYSSIYRLSPQGQE